ncbi:hypothetical protein JCM8547_009148 [Rhodosporidiobolus lusitaniae]
MATVDVKLKHQEEARLLSLPATQAPLWADLASQVQQRFALDSPPTALTYVDEDGDEITVSSDVELAELFNASVGETSLSFSLVLEQDKQKDDKPARSPETVALLDNVREALKKDLTLVDDLRSVVHDVLPPPPFPPHHHFRHFHHPKHGFAGFSSRGRGGGRRRGCHGLWEMRQPSESSSSSSESEEDAASATEKQPSPAHNQGDTRREHGHKRHGKGFKHHVRPFQPPVFGPPPAHHHRHDYRGAFPPPPPTSFFPSGGVDFFTPPPPPPFGFEGPHKHGKKSGKHGFHHSPPPPPFFPSGEESAFSQRDPAFGRHRHHHAHPAAFFEGAEGFEGRRGRRHHRF